MQKLQTTTKQSKEYIMRTSLKLHSASVSINTPKNHLETREYSTQNRTSTIQSPFLFSTTATAVSIGSENNAFDKCRICRHIPMYTQSPKQECSSQEPYTACVLFHCVHHRPNVYPSTVPREYMENCCLPAE